jgi:aminoglycoside phosphotransferase (APT) family kinase protein
MIAPARLELSQAELISVSDYLRSCGVDLAGPLTADLIAGGRSNLTYKIEDGVSRWVLRMPPRSGRTPSAHDVVREYRVTNALYGTGVPVAQPVALCADLGLIGCEFFISEFVPGITVQSREQLDVLDSVTVNAISDRLVRTLAELHRVDPSAVGLDGFGRPNGYAERQIRRWSSQWELVAIGDADVRRCAAELSRRLAASIPSQRSVAIVHGDFRIDNTLLQLRGEAGVEVSAIVDWELSTLGDPIADLAMMCGYRHAAFDLIVGAPSAWTSPRLPSPDALAGAYEAVGGAPVEHWEFHLALAYFKIAVIAAGIDHRVHEGAASGPGFDTSGTSVPHFIAAGLEALANTS